MNRLKSILIFIFLIVGFHKTNAQVNMDSLDAINERMMSTDISSFQKAFISKRDSSILVVANMRKDHRFYGYEKANTNSTKLILFSIFTPDVEGNPFNLQYGASYDSNASRMKGRRLKYVATEANFIKTHLIDESSNKIIAIIYFEKKWFELE